jgi:hypothetical protein
MAGAACILVARGRERFDGSVEQCAGSGRDRQRSNWVLPGVGDNRIGRVRGRISRLSRDIANSVDTLPAHRLGSTDGSFERWGRVAANFIDLIGHCLTILRRIACD